MTLLKLPNRLSLLLFQGDFKLFKFNFWGMVLSYLKILQETLKVYQKIPGFAYAQLTFFFSFLLTYGRYHLHMSILKDILK